MSTIVSAGLVGVSIQTMRVPSGQPRASPSRSVRSADAHSTPVGPSTCDTSRKVPPYASVGSSTPSPGATVRSTASSAAIPLANANPRAAPSSEARHVSYAIRVGFAVRAYSNPACSPTAVCTNVDDSVIGGTTAPVTGSGGWPWWMARVSNRSLPEPSVTGAPSMRGTSARRIG